MKLRNKKFVFLLAVSVCLLSVLTAVGIAALETEQIVCTSDGVEHGVSLVDGAATLPTPEELALETVTDRVFVGWKTVNAEGAAILLPAGAVVSAEDGDRYEAVYIKMSTLSTATLRIVDGDVGMRFATEVDRADYEALTALVGDDGVSMGTYIVAGEYLIRQSVTEVMYFTIESLAERGYTQYIDIPAERFSGATETTLTYTGAVVNLLRGNYTRKYAGIGYMLVNYSDGTTGKLYCQYRSADHRHSIYDMVFDAFNDRGSTHSAAYPNLIRSEDGNYYYSPYTQAQIDTLKAYLDRCVSLSHGTGYKKWTAIRSAYYTPPYSASFVEEPTGVGTITIVPQQGKTVDDIWGLQIGGTFYDLNDASKATFADGKLYYLFDTNSKAY